MTLSLLENIEFKVLKKPSLLERIITISFFLLIYLLGMYFGIEYVNKFDQRFSYLNAKTASIVFLGILIFIERQYDGFVRNRRIGKGSISASGINILDKSFDFNSIKMLWINYGINTKTNNEIQYLFKDFETINLSVIDNNDKITKFHIDNDSINSKELKVTDFIENLKKNHFFFKIHFHEQRKFSKSEYEKTQKRYGIMQNTLKNRPKRRK
jgi:ABC-type amino acid transport substrate-binding protein